MSTFLKSYELVGDKEDVAKAISNISPQETPFISMSLKASIHNTLFQWQTDIDGTPVAGAGVAQGADAVFADLSEPQMLKSNTQIFAFSAKVAGTSEAMGLYGRSKPMAYQMMKAGRVMKKSLEMTMLSNQATKSAAAGQVGLLSGVGTTGKMSDGEPACPNVLRAATAKTFLEAELQKLLNHLWSIGATPSVIMYPPEYASALSALRDTTSSTNMFDGGADATVNRKVDVYVDPLGQRLKLIPNRYMPKDVMYILDPNLFEQKILRNFSTKDLPAGGDYVAKQLLGEIGLANKNPEGMGIYNLISATDESYGDTTTPVTMASTAPIRSAKK